MTGRRGEKRMGGLGFARVYVKERTHMNIYDTYLEEHVEEEEHGTEVCGIPVRE